jgi:hypothetical protein
VIGSQKSFSMEIATKPLVMASEIAGLEPLRGFVKQENRVVAVEFARNPGSWQMEVYSKPYRQSSAP